MSFSISKNGSYLNNTAYFIVCDKEEDLDYLLHVLNSKLIEWYYRTISVQLGEKGIRMFSIYINKLPIPLFNDDFDYVDEYNVNNYLYQKFCLCDEEIRYISIES